MESVWGVDHGGEVSKARGDWQTIDQRELKARRARRGQRTGAALASAGGGAALAGYISRPEESHKLAKITRASGDLAVHGHRNIGRVMLRGGVRNNPVGAVTLAGAALGAGGAAKWGVHRANEGYQQSMINRRRKRNAGIRKALTPPKGIKAPTTAKGPTVTRTPVKQTMASLPQPPKKMTPSGGTSLRPPQPTQPQRPGQLTMARSLLKPSMFAAGGAGAGGGAGYGAGRRNR